MKQPIVIDFMPDLQMCVKIVKLPLDDCKCHFEHEKSVLTQVPQMEMLRQVYGGNLIYLEFITVKAIDPTILNIQTKETCIIFIYVVEGVFRFSLLGDSEIYTVAEGQNFAMYFPERVQQLHIDKGESVIFFFILQSQFISDIQADYKEIAELTKQLMTMGNIATLSNFSRTTNETKKIIKKIRTFKTKTRLMQELVILKAISKVITQYILVLQSPILVPFRSSKEIGYAVRDHIIAEIDRGVIPQVNEILEYFKIESKALRRICLKIFNMNTQSLIIESKMKIAHVFVKRGIMIKEIAFQLGYSEPAAFSRAFKKHFGYSPSNEDQYLGKR